MDTHWGSPRNEDVEPNTAFIAMDVSVDPGNPTGLAVARTPMKPAPYAEPDELQNGGNYD